MKFELTDAAILCHHKKSLWESLWNGGKDTGISEQEEIMQWKMKE